MDDEEVNKKIADYLSTLPMSYARFIVSINGWFGHPKKSASKLATSIFPEDRVMEIYNQEIKKLKTVLFLGEEKGKERK